MIYLEQRYAAVAFNPLPKSIQIHPDPSSSASPSLDPTPCSKVCNSARSSWTAEKLVEKWFKMLKGLEGKKKLDWRDWKVVANIGIAQGGTRESNRIETIERIGQIEPKGHTDVEVVRRCPKSCDVWLLHLFQISLHRWKWHLKGRHDDSTQAVQQSTSSTYLNMLIQSYQS